MRLSNTEFRAMNSGLRGFFHRRVEFPLFVRLGLDEARARDVVELGCGNGLGAELIARLGPKSYVGLDVMPEQIALAEQRGLPRAQFRVGDASAVELPDESADVVVIFGILHHVERWQQALGECRRLLRPGGCLVLEEPDATLLGRWDRLFHWGHPDTGFSLKSLEQTLLRSGWNIEVSWKLGGLFGAYRARRPQRLQPQDG